MALYVGVEMGHEGQSGLPLLIKLNMKTRLDTQSGSKVEKGMVWACMFWGGGRVVNESNILEGENLGLWGGGQRAGTDSGQVLYSRKPRSPAGRRSWDKGAQTQQTLMILPSLFAGSTL